MNKKLLVIMKHHFPEQEAEELWDSACQFYKKMLPLADSETGSRRKNMVKGIFPFAAVYRALLNKGYKKEEAMDYMYAVMEENTRNGMRKMYERMGKFPFFFRMFRFMFSKGLKGDSWKVDWVSDDEENFEYNIMECLWCDVCSQLGCPELCKIFCRNDEINFIGVSPYLHFQRKMTLGNGDDCCDFHFYRHEPKK